MKRLQKSSKNKVFAGILGGIGEYLNMDSTIIRLIFLLVLIMSGIFPAVIVYAIAYFIIPDEEPKVKDAPFTEKKPEEKKEEPKTEEVK